MKPMIALLGLLILAALPANALETVTLNSPSPLVEIRVMLKSGSAQDPAGKEGLASITAQLLLEGGYSLPDGSTMDKEALSTFCRPLGSGASPGVRVAKEATTFRMRVPRERLNDYVENVFGPLFTSPTFDEGELERVKKESATQLAGWLRYESTEMLGLSALDNYIFAGTSRGHVTGGSVQGIAAITVEDVRGFYAEHYRQRSMILGLSTDDAELRETLAANLKKAGRMKAAAHRPETFEVAEPAPIRGREAVVVGVPDAIATGMHLAFPIEVDRNHPDYWPLYVANVHLGTHRDSHGRLYEQIRRERGYNYGDYSYMEHFAGRPFSLFPPFNTPRSNQYFSIWIRPVQHEYAHHLLKAAVAELDHFIATGMTEDEVARSRNKARVLYLNLAESTGRLLEARLDDKWYGLTDGWLDHYLAKIEAVTPEQVNAAIGRHLQTKNLKMVLVTGKDGADQLAADLVKGGAVYGKLPADYDLELVKQEDGSEFWQIPPSRLVTLQRDAIWANTPLGLKADRVRSVPVEALFETGDFLSTNEKPVGAR